MNCIYCHNDSTNSKNKEHIFPANLGIDETLPIGCVCDKCNNYFAKMDETVLYNSYISLNVIADQIPARNGKSRACLGRFEYLENREFKINFVATISPGMDQVTLKMKQPREFNEFVFIRGIHKIAFNCFANQFGQKECMNSKFDKIAKYIRHPDTGKDLWTYAVKLVNPDKECNAKFLKQINGIILVHLHLICFDFIISLTAGEWWDKYKIQLPDFTIIKRPGCWNEPSLSGLKR